MGGIGCLEKSGMDLGKEEPAWKMQAINTQGTDWQKRKRKRNLPRHTEKAHNSVNRNKLMKPLKHRDI